MGPRLYLFLRGPCRQPIFTWTTDGVHWARARTLMLGIVRGGRRQRPYAKYAAGRRGISMVFTDGHPYSVQTSLYYLRMRGGRFYRADGSLLGGLRDLPFRASALDPVYRHRRGGGRAWPMDVALDAQDRPVIVYTRATGHGDDFWYARWEGAWASRPWPRPAAATAATSTAARACATRTRRGSRWPPTPGTARTSTCICCTPPTAARAGPGCGCPTRARRRATGQCSRAGRPRARPLLEWVSGWGRYFRDYRTRVMMAG